MEHPSTPSINSGQASSGQVGHGVKDNEQLKALRQKSGAEAPLVGFEKWIG
jgi:hypothetical protein